MSFGTRLKEKRESLGITQPQLAELLSVSKGAIGNWETDVNSPRSALLYDLFKILHCDANYLFQDETRELYKDAASPEEFEYIIKKYRNLDDFGRETVDTVLTRETKRIEDIRAKQKQLSDQQDQIDMLKQRIATEIVHRFFLPFYAGLASAGSGEYLFDDIPTDMIEVEDTPTARMADFVIGVNGDSMEPDFCNGEKVFVKKTADLNIGDIGIFLKGNDCYIKELGKDRLISRNKDHDDIWPDEEIKTVGKVIGKVEE